MSHQVIITGGQAYSTRARARLAVAADGESFVSGWPDGRATVEASIAENGGFWAPLTAADYDGQGLTCEQVARIVGGSTPHPGATLTEPAVLARPLGELPARILRRSGVEVDQGL